MVLVEDVEREFTLLNPGSIRDIFTRKTPPPLRKLSSPLSLPQHAFQCVHVQLREDGTSDRCFQNVVRAQNGYLCKDHQKGIDFSVRNNSWIPERDKEQEIVESIILSEQREIAQIERQVVVFSSRGEKIQFVRGLRMKTEVFYDEGGY